MAQNVPLDKRYPNVYLEFDILPGQNWGHNVKSMIMRGMANAGYVIEIEISDPEGAMMTKFIEQGYYEKSRVTPIEMTFAFLSGYEEISPPEYTTPLQKAIITHTEDYIPTDDRVNISFIAVDPCSFYLNMGSASGKSYRGRLDQVITQVVNEYAPKISFKMSKTKDSALNRYYMMRQDPKTFITNNLEWSSPLNDTKTNWIVQVDGYKMEINDQGGMTSKKRGYYTRFAGAFNDSIASADVVANNALNLVHTKIVSPGVTTVTGEIFDKFTDEKEQYSVAKDSTTTNKKIPKIDRDHSFIKPNDAPSSQYPDIGMTHIRPIPEYAIHDIGVDYRDYMDGRAREHYLVMTRSVLKTKLVVKGHGEYINTYGLGVDTILIDWKRSESPEDRDEDFWMAGVWIIYGFEHTFKASTWYTTLYIYRTDMDAQGQIVS